MRINDFRLILVLLPLFVYGCSSRSIPPLNESNQDSCDNYKLVFDKEVNWSPGFEFLNNKLWRCVKIGKYGKNSLDFFDVHPSWDWDPSYIADWYIEGFDSYDLYYPCCLINSGERIEYYPDVSPYDNFSLGLPGEDVAKTIYRIGSKGDTLVVKEMADLFYYLPIEVDPSILSNLINIKENPTCFIQRWTLDSVRSTITWEKVPLDSVDYEWVPRELLLDTLPGKNHFIDFENSMEIRNSQGELVFEYVDLFRKRGNFNLVLSSVLNTEQRIYLNEYMFYYSYPQGGYFNQPDPSFSL